MLAPEVVSRRGHVRTRRTGRVATGAAAIATATLFLPATDAAAAPAAVTGVAPASTTAAQKITISGNAYSAPELTVRPGTAVTWFNKDEAPHTVTVTAGPEKFDSGTVEKGRSYTHRFNRAGTYRYYCAVHPEMVAQVVVRGAKGEPTQGSDAPAQTGPVSGLLQGLLPRDTEHSSARPVAHLPASLPAVPAPDDDPSTEHTPRRHGDNTDTPAGGGERSATPTPSSYPWQPAADPASGAIDPFLAHLEAAHLNRGPGAQAQDIAEFDSWGRTHLFLLRQMTEYFQGRDSVYGNSPGTSTFAQHMDSAHYTRSPMGQVTDITQFDSWNRSHLALVRTMLDPAVGTGSAAASVPALAVFLQHMDAAHWNTSVNGQATAITDDFQGWLTSHQKLVETMLAASGDGSADRRRDR